MHASTATPPARLEIVKLPPGSGLYRLDLAKTQAAIDLPPDGIVLHATCPARQVACVLTLARPDFEARFLRRVGLLLARHTVVEWSELRGRLEAEAQGARGRLDLYARGRRAQVAAARFLHGLDPDGHAAIGDAFERGEVVDLRDDPHGWLEFNDQGCQPRSGAFARRRRAFVSFDGWNAGVRPLHLPVADTGARLRRAVRVDWQPAGGYALPRASHPQSTAVPR